ncbi:MAG: polysaccharide deacetylase family protein [Microbacter sp.]
MKLLLSFDIEEFDTPLKYGKSLTINEQLAPSLEGTKQILSLLSAYQVKATFFCTAHFAQSAPELLRQMVTDGHEVASHGYSHASFSMADFEASKKVLEEITAVPVVGFRMPRMQPVDTKMLLSSGYEYDASLHPTFLPGHYNHRKKPRTWFRQDGIWEMPASVTPHFRIPLFWLSFHLFPWPLYRFMLQQTIRHDTYALLYFHPWEFVDLQDPRFGIPCYIRYHSGLELLNRLEKLIQHAIHQHWEFSTITDFIRQQK